MSLFTPELGLVFPYWYLWGDQAVNGYESGHKPRPALIVAVCVDGSCTQVVVSPFTTSKPSQNVTYMEADLSWGTSLPRYPCYLILDEQNAFRWPGFDLPDNPVPYGKLNARVMRSILERVSSLDSVPVNRD